MRLRALGSGGARISVVPSDIEDLVHEVSLIFEARLPNVSGEAHLATWLYRITGNVARHQRRKQRTSR